MATAMHIQLQQTNKNNKHSSVYSVWHLSEQTEQAHKSQPLRQLPFTVEKQLEIQAVSVVVHLK